MIMGAFWRIAAAVAARVPDLPSRRHCISALLAATLGATLVAACEGPPDPTDEHAVVPADQIERLTGSIKPEEALINPDDVLTITFLKRYPNDNSQYRFDVGDAIELQFFTSTEQPQTYVIQPDGRIYLPEIGSLMVRGLTTDEIARRIVNGYKSTRMAGPVNVVARTTDVKVNELISGLKGTTDGSKMTVTVLPDGTISLPLVDVVTVAGDTVGEVESMLNERYGLLFADMHVSVALQASNSRRYGVLGSVAAPGVFPLVGHTTILEALAKAGGVRDEAKHGTTSTFSLIVIRKTPQGGMRTEQLAIGSSIAMTQLAQLELRPSDVLYVPQSHIAELNLFVSQYLVKMLPLNLGYGYSSNVPLQ
jgi:protein involved in polysaccharide export with SLBB domain